MPYGGENLKITVVVGVGSILQEMRRVVLIFLFRVNTLPELPFGVHPAELTADLA